LDQPLRQAWESFAATNLSSEATSGVTLDNFATRLAAVESSATELSHLRGLIEQRLALPTNVLDQMRSPFQLIDFENERLLRGESLQALAKARKIGFTPGASNGLPRYSAELSPAAQPLLWPRLHFTTQLLLTAMHSQVGAVLELAQLPPVTHRSRRDGRVLLEEIPMRIEVLGSIEAVSRFLTSLPLRGAELDAAQLTTVLSNKPPLFINHLFARKAAPDRPADIKVELEVSGFVPMAGMPGENGSSLEVVR
jgi:hypothetical protein